MKILKMMTLQKVGNLVKAIKARSCWTNVTNGTNLASIHISLHGANERWSHILNNGSVKSQIAGIFLGKITDIKWHFVALKKP